MDIRFTTALTLPQAMIRILIAGALALQLAVPLSHAATAPAAAVTLPA